MGQVLDILNNEVRMKISAGEEILHEARARRDLVAESAMGIEGALRWFRSGSVAHAMVNGPVSDADSGIVLDRRVHPALGPDGADEGPDGIIDQLQALITPKVLEKYPRAVVKKSRRGLLVEFNEPVTDEEDPSVDLIVTLTRKDADGLWIPDRDSDDWTPSHPEKHTELFTSGARDVRALRARVARMGKAWNHQWDEGDRALSSFNIATLAWEDIEDGSVSLAEALDGWFRYAHDELDKAETKDPAGVSDPIRLLLPKSEVVARLGDAADDLDEALANEGDEDKVREALSRVYHDYVDGPQPSGKEALAAALRGGNEGVGASKAGLLVGGGTPMKTTRSFGGEPDG